MLGLAYFAIRRLNLESRASVCVNPDSNSSRQAPGFAKDSGQQPAAANPYIDSAKLLRREAPPQGEVGPAWVGRSDSIPASGP